MLNYSLWDRKDYRYNIRYSLVTSYWWRSSAAGREIVSGKPYRQPPARDGVAGTSDHPACPEKDRQSFSGHFLAKPVHFEELFIARGSAFFAEGLRGDMFILRSE